jgi:uncharacterized repeat protein (TIGR03803 family)
MNVKFVPTLKKTPAFRRRLLSFCLLAATFVAFAVSTPRALAVFPLQILTSFNPGFGNGITQATDGNLYGITPTGGDYGFGAIFKITPAGKLTLLTSFTSAVPTGTFYGNLIQGADGNLYGTGASGETNGDSGLFLVTLAGQVTNDASFVPSNNVQPGLLMQAANGDFYATCSQGGTNGAGAIYQITTNGTLAVLYTFNGQNDAGQPESPLVQGTNGLLYGTAAGGTNNPGVLFTISTSGAFAVVASFDGTNGAIPWGSLAADNKGNFYGTTTQGGAYDSGVAFKVTPAGDLTVLADFTGTNGATPMSGLVAGADGNFYGTTLYGGRYGGGTVFRMSSAGRITTLFSFRDKDGPHPLSLARGKNGTFYGATYSTVFKVASSGSVTTLVRPGGNMPQALVRSGDGTFYGTTAVGGDSDQGTAFRLSPGGTLTTLASFGGSAGMGEIPGTVLVEGRNGDLYGTTLSGGAATNGSGGTIYKMTHGGKITTLVSFNQDPFHIQNGAYPTSLIQDPNGDFYGTTYTGGIPTDGNIPGYGTVFKMSSAGEFTTLASFDGTNGVNPSTLILGRNGNFYGITQGKLASPYSGQAAVFEATPQGRISTLFTFDAATGTTPCAFLQDKNGDFYGLTTNNSNSAGAVFQLTQSGTLTNIVQFDPASGLRPSALVEASDGTLYCGMQINGAQVPSNNSSSGVLFRIATNGNAVQMATFNGVDGANPVLLVPASSGRLYGVASSGGAFGGGDVFAFAPGSFAGLFYEPTNINPASSGSFSLNISLNLRFSGLLKIGAENHHFSGVFDSQTLSATVEWTRSHKNILLMNLQLSPDGRAISGAVTDNALWYSLIDGAGEVDGPQNPPLQAARYSFSLTNTNSDLSILKKNSAGLLTLAQDGTVALGGTLSDGSVLSQSVPLLEDGRWPLYIPLYHGAGSLIGWVTFTNAAAQLDGALVWSKTNTIHPAGSAFTNAITMQGLIQSK